MNTLRIKMGWDAMLVGGLVIAALATGLVVGAGWRVASAGAPAGQGYGAYQDVAAPAAAQDTALLDTFDRGAAAFAAAPARRAADETALMDTFDRATAAFAAPAAGAGLGDTFDRATAAFPQPASAPTDLSDRHTPAELARIMGWTSK
jgi:hypothetical protein